MGKLYAPCLLIVLLSCPAFSATVVVPDDFPSITAAIAAANAGDTIQIREGTYEENVVFGQSLVLQGMPDERVEVVGDHRVGHGVAIEPGVSVTISGIQFRQVNTPAVDDYEAERSNILHITGAWADISDCQFTGAGGRAICVTSDSSVTIRRCIATDCGYSGIYIGGPETDAIIEDCTTSSNAYYGVSLTDSAVAEINGLTANDNRVHGIRIDSEADATAADVTVFHNSRVGILVKTGASLILRDSSSTGNGTDGLCVQDTGTHVDLTRCEFDANKAFGVAVWPETDVRVRNCNCTANSGYGIGIWGYAQDVILDSNHCTKNKVGIAVMYASSAVVTDNRCDNNSEDGILVTHWDTRATVSGNYCSDNGRNGIAVSQGASATLDNNSCQNNGACGIEITDQGTTADLADNDCVNNTTDDSARTEGKPLGRQTQVCPEVIGWLFMTDHFDTIESLANRVREYRSCNQYGTWQLRELYEGIAKGYDNIDENKFDEFKEQLKKYADACEDSPTPQVARIRFHITTAWRFRGGGWASSVTDDQWKGFKEHLNAANDMCEKLDREGRVDSQMYAAWLTVIRGLGESEHKLDEVFAKGHALDPAYGPLYQSKAIALLRRWGGDRGEVERFARNAAQLGGDEAGASMEAIVALAVLDYVGVETFVNTYRFQKEDWTRQKTAFEDLRTRFYGAQNYLNFYCLMACLQNDSETAAALFKEIGDKPDGDIWGDEEYEYFNEWKQWADGNGTRPHIGSGPDPRMMAFGVIAVTGAVVLVPAAVVVILLIIYHKQRKGRAW